MTNSKRISIDLELKDIPGQLALALAPISECGGIIKDVCYQSKKKTEKGTIPTSLTFDVEHINLPQILEKIGHCGTINHTGEERLTEELTVILIGHIVHTDIKDTINTIDSTGKAEVIDLLLSMPSIEGESSAQMTISAICKKELSNARALLHKIAELKDILIIEPIGLCTEVQS